LEGTFLGRLVKRSKASKASKAFFTVFLFNFRYVYFTLLHTQVYNIMIDEEGFDFFPWCSFFWGERLARGE
jgi:hypothetical protein